MAETKQQKAARRELELSYANQGAPPVMVESDDALADSVAANQVRDAAMRQQMAAATGTPESLKTGVGTENMTVIPEGVGGGLPTPTKDAGTDELIESLRKDNTGNVANGMGGTGGGGGKGITTKPVAKGGFMDKLMSGGWGDPSVFHRIAAGAAEQGGFQDYGQAHLAGAETARREWETDEALRLKEAQMNNAQLNKETDRQLKKQIAALKASEDSVKDDRKVIGYEGLSKHTSTINGTRQLDDMIMPLLDTKEGIADLRAVSKWNSTTRHYSGGEEEKSRIQKLSAAWDNSAEAIIRGESGAAVPDSEIKRLAKRYKPAQFDTDETMRWKINELYTMGASKLSSTQQLYRTGNEYTPKHYKTTQPSSSGGQTSSTPKDTSKDTQQKLTPPKNAAKGSVPMKHPENPRGPNAIQWVPSEEIKDALKEGYLRAYGV